MSSNRDRFSFSKSFQPTGYTNFKQVTPVPAEAMSLLMKNVARYQLELWALASRRGQAYLELPGRIARCRTPQDFSREQARFLKTSMEQYAQATQRLNQSFQEAFVAPLAKTQKETAITFAPDVYRPAVTVTPKVDIQNEGDKDRRQAIERWRGRQKPENRQVA